MQHLAVELRGVVKQPKKLTSFIVNDRWAWHFFSYMTERKLKCKEFMVYMYIP